MGVHAESTGEGVNQSVGRWRLSTLGQLAVRDRDGGAVGLHSRPSLLLAYLVDRREPVLRTDLAKLFWPEAPAQRARHGLRQALSRIRRVLGADVVVGGDPVAIDTSRFDTDVDRFLARLEEGRIDAALDLCDGCYLNGLGGDASWEIQEWIDMRRRELEAVLLDRGRGAVRGLMAADDLDPALALVLRLQACLPAEPALALDAAELLLEAGRPHEAEVELDRAHVDGSTQRAVAIRRRLDRTAPAAGVVAGAGLDEPVGAGEPVGAVDSVGAANSVGAGEPVGADKHWGPGGPADTVGHPGADDAAETGRDADLGEEVEAEVGVAAAAAGTAGGAPATLGLRPGPSRSGPRWGWRSLVGAVGIGAVVLGFLRPAALPEASIWFCAEREAAEEADHGFSLELPRRAIAGVSEGPLCPVMPLTSAGDSILALTGSAATGMALELMVGDRVRTLLASQRMRVSFPHRRAGVQDGVISPDGRWVLVSIGESGRSGEAGVADESGMADGSGAPAESGMAVESGVADGSGAPGESGAADESGMAGTVFSEAEVFSGPRPADGRQVPVDYRSNRSRGLQAVMVEIATGEVRRIGPPGVSTWDPRFTPDGSSVVYFSGATGAGDLYRHDLATGTSERLSSDPRPERSVVAGREWTVWVAGAGTPEDPDQVMALEHATGSVREVHAAPWPQQRPDLSPDEERICWTSRELGHWESDIVVADVDGGGRPRTLHSVSRETHCQWLDAKNLLFRSHRTGRAELFVQSVRLWSTAENVTFWDADVGATFVVAEPYRVEGDGGGGR